MLIHCHQPHGNRGVRRIDVTNPAYDPLAYPLLFPHGEIGWHTTIQHSHGDKHTTLRQYYTYLMMDRINPDRNCDTIDPDFNVLHHAGKYYI